MGDAFSDRRAHARLARLEQGRAVTSATDAAAVIAYHELQPPRTTEAPAWARAALRVATSLAGVLHTVLMTNSRAVGLRGAPFHQVVHVDLLQLAGLGSAVHDTRPRWTATSGRGGHRARPMILSSSVPNRTVSSA